MRAAFAAQGGREQSAEGDAVFVIFPTASDTVAGALAAQRSLVTQRWPGDAAVRVRMGVHVGEIQTVAGTIMRMAVHEAARIGAAAHGGQVLASARTAELSGALCAGAAWLDLGRHFLKDIGSAVQLFHLPRFRSHPVAGSESNNLRAKASACIGRERSR